MSDTTNLNNSGFGAPQNWTAAGQQPPIGTPPKNMPQPTSVDEAIPAAVNGKGGGGGGGGKVSTDTTAQQLQQEELIWQDILSSQAEAAQNVNLNLKNPLSQYVTYSDQPNLAQPLINDPIQARQTLQAISTPTPDKVQAFLQNMQAAFPSSISPQDYEQYANVVVTDPEINALAQKMRIPAGIIQKNVQSEANNEFTALISELPPDIANQLEFAEFVPQAATNLSPELAAQLNSINQQVQQGVANNFGFSANWQGITPDPTLFLSQLSNEADAAFQQLLDAKVADGSLTEAEATTLKAMNNSLATGSPALKTLLAHLQGQVAAQLQAKYGFDAGYQPKGDTAFYSNMVNGEFAQTYQKNVAKYTGSATAEQKVLLQKYAANPNDPSIEESIKQLAQQIAEQQNLLLQAYPDPNNSSLSDNLKSIATDLISQSTNTVIANNNLDATWQPTIPTLLAAGVDPTTIQNANTAISTGQEAVNQATTIINQMPDSPEKTQYLAFLKVIGQALNTLQQAVYAMQAAQSNTSKALSNGQLQTQLDNIAMQQRSADAVQQKEGKMANMGPIGQVFTWIFKIVILAVSLCTGPIGFAIALAYFTDSAVSAAQGNSQTYTDKMFAAISNALPPAAAAVVNFTIAATISLASGNVFLAMNLIGQDCGFVQDAVKACGGDAMAQSIAAMVVNLVIQIAFIVVVLVVTGGAATPAIAGEVASMIAEATNITLETAEKVVKISMIIMQVIMASLQIASDGISINNNILLSQIDIIKGQAEAYSEQLEAMIAQIKHVIDKLLQMIQGNSDMIVSISNFQGQKWSSASQVTSDIFG